MDDGAQRLIREARADGCVDRSQFVRSGVPKRDAKNDRIAEHGFDWIDVRGTAAAYEDDTAAWSKNRKVAAKIHVGQHLDDYVVTTTSGKGERLVKMVGNMVVDYFVRSLFEDEFPAAV